MSVMSVIVSRNPATGAVLREIGATAPDQLPAIFERARQAQARWAALPIHKRARVLIQLRETILNHVDEVTDLISAENGKPRFEAMANELLPSVDMLTFFAKKGPKILRNHRIPMGLMKHRASYLNYWPLGVVAVISPWNYPFMLAFGEIVMALIAGNAVIFKPSEVTPLVGLKIQELADEAGLPPNVLQTLVGDGALGAAIIQQKPAKIFFTGSVATGKKIMAAAAEHLIPVNLELGGKDAMIVLPDADLDFASSAALWGGYSNSGQICASTERLIVHESIVQPFTEKLKAKLEQLRQGPPDGAGSVDLGAITFEKQKAIYERHMQQAREKGAVFVTGGEFSADRRFLKPVLVTGPQIESLDIYNEETFGPVIAMTTFKSDAEAIEKANRSRYGLLAAVIGRDLSRAEHVARQLEVGTVTVNEVTYTGGLGETPWGGVKESGFGRSHSAQGLYEFVNVRHIHKPRSRLFVFKSLWWFPYTEHQYATFRKFFDLYRRHWLDRLRAFPLVLWEFVQFLKREKRL
jgi:succinate-semialdehyde dehydrogenase/glutarate-semialdehyde dehydrogenase